MDRLYPIVRRKRRPLVVVETPTDTPVPEKIEPVQPVVLLPPVTPGKPTKSRK